MPKHARLLLVIFLSFSLPAGAAFRIHKGQHKAHYGASPNESSHDAYQNAVSLQCDPQTDKPQSRRSDLSPYDRFNSTTEGTLALACAIIALVGLGALALTSFSLLAVPVFLFGGLAAVLGGIGIRRLKPGYAIAGLTLGLLDIVACFMVLALLL